MKELEEENLNEVEEIKENEKLETTDFSDNEMEMVELSETEQLDLTGGASASGPNFGYIVFYLDIGNVAKYQPEAYMKVAGTKIEAEQYRVVDGCGVKWKWQETGTVKFMFQAGPDAPRSLEIRFYGRIQGSMIVSKTFHGFVSRPDKSWRVTRF